MAPASKRTVSHFALAISFLGSIVLGALWLQIRSERNMIREQILALAAVNAELVQNSIVRQKQANDEKAAVEERLGRLENAGPVPAELDAEKRAFASEIAELRTAITTMRQQAVDSKQLLLNEIKPENAIRPAPAKSLTITIVSDGNGQAASTMVGLGKLFDGPIDADRVRQLDRRLKDVFAIEGTCDQVLLRVGTNLCFWRIAKSHRSLRPAEESQRKTGGQDQFCRAQRTVVLSRSPAERSVFQRTTIAEQMHPSPSFGAQRDLLTTPKTARNEGH